MQNLKKKNPFYKTKRLNIRSKFARCTVDQLLIQAEVAMEFTPQELSPRYRR